MAVLDTRVPIIGIDGNHRTGKGTQLDILHHKLLGDGYKPLILRGDEATSTSPETPEVFWANINKIYHGR